MTPNPFKKYSFPSHREWKQKLIFLSEQLRAPTYAGWAAFAVDVESRKCAAFMSHQLVNIAYIRRLPSEDELRLIFERLMGRPVTEGDLRERLADHWINYSRFHAKLYMPLKNQFSRHTHYFLAK